MDDRPLQAHAALPRRARRARPQHAAEGHAGRHLARASPSAGALPHGGTIPVGQTTSPIDSDELLASLDTDTRTWFTSLITELSAGHRAAAARTSAQLLRSLGPTTAQLRQIGDLLAGRRARSSPRSSTTSGALTQADQRQGRPAADRGQGRRPTVAARWPARTSRCATRSSQLPGTLRATARRRSTDVDRARQRARPDRHRARCPPRASCRPRSRDTQHAVPGRRAAAAASRSRRSSMRSLPLAAQLPPLTRRPDRRSRR